MAYSKISEEMRDYRIAQGLSQEQIKVEECKDSLYDFLNSYSTDNIVGDKFHQVQITGTRDILLKQIMNIVYPYIR